MLTCPRRGEEREDCGGQGRASAWGGAPHSGSPGAGGKRPRLVSRALRPPAVQEAATEGARETDAAGAPSLPPKKRVGFRPKRLHAGSGTAWRGRGRPDTSLLVIEPGVCHLSFGLAKCMCPRTPPGGSCPERWGVRAGPRPLPVGSALQSQELTGRRAGGVGRPELPEARVPCPALSTCHCMQPVRGRP